MGKKTSKQKSYISDEKRRVTEAFASAARRANRLLQNSKGAEFYDLEGAILKRRCDATTHYLGIIKERYQQQYPELDVTQAWIEHNCAMGHSADGADQLYYITFAAAVWMLDVLNRSCNLQNAASYFTTDMEALQSVRLPDVFDPCHDELLLKGMMHLIQNRDQRDNPFQWHINDVSARRRKPVTPRVPEDPADLTDRDRFNAVMAMIDPRLKERAVQRFEEKFWDFLDRHFYCLAHYAKEIRQLEEKADSIAAQYSHRQSILSRQIAEYSSRWSIPSDSASLSVPLAVASPTVPSNPLAALKPDKEATTKIDQDLHALQAMASRGEALVQQLDEIYHKYNVVQSLSHMFFTADPWELEDIDPEIADHILAFEVDDPYETCFAYLCLLEAGSDLPWLYNTSLAVLLAAASKFPWTAEADDDAFEPEDTDEMDPADDGVPTAEDAPDPASEDPYAENGPFPEAPVDWSLKAAPQYKKIYSDAALYAPLLSPTPERKLNLPQIVYGLTGMLMPRTNLDFDGFAEDFVAEGMSQETAELMEQYLLLASLTQYQNKDWPRYFQSYKFQALYDRYGPAASKTHGSPANPEELRLQVKQLKKENERLTQELYEANRQRELAYSEVRQVKLEAADQHQELVSLRSLVFNQSNDPEREGTEAEDPAITLPYESQRRIVIFGGHDSWLKAIRPMLPNVTFANRNPNEEMIRNADIIWFQPNALSHKDFYKITNVARTYRIPVRYFAYASARKCAEQLALDDAAQTN